MNIELQKREKKTLSAKGLLKIVRNAFESIPTAQVDPRGRKKEITQTDSLMSALAMFSLKSQSLLSFDRVREKSIVKHNLKSFYGIKQAPSDTYMREELDLIDPSFLRNCFSSIFEEIQRGKILEQYKYLDTYLLAIDGTEMFSSEKTHCVNCCEKNHRNGKKVYYHQTLGASIVHPNRRQVIPLCPELISRQDGKTKNDCEQRAIERFLSKFKKEHPRLKTTLLLDALYSTAPVINEIKNLKLNFIINVKPSGNKGLFDWIRGLELEESSVSVKANSYKFRFINNIPLNNTTKAPDVNFLECISTEVKGRKVTEKQFTWVTDHNITKKNVYELMKGGRCRWKIENETFNTLKNQGYQFEHNFGHGKKNLMSVFILIMMIAFLIDQIQEAACGLFQAALQKTITRRDLWNNMKNYFFTYFIDSWKHLFTAIITDFGINMSSEMDST